MTTQKEDDKDLCLLDDAKDLCLLGDDDFLRVMINSKELLPDAIVHLDDRCFLLLILTLTDDMMIPALLSAELFLTMHRVEQLNKFGSDLYNLENYHIIANNINMSSHESTNQSIDLLDASILPSNEPGVNRVIKALTDHLPVDKLKLLEFKMKQNLTKIVSVPKSNSVGSVIDRSVKTIVDNSVKKPVRWLVNASETIVNASTDIFKKRQVD